MAPVNDPRPQGSGQGSDSVHMDVDDVQDAAQTLLDAVDDPMDVDSSSDGAAPAPAVERIGLSTGGRKNDPPRKPGPKGRDKAFQFQICKHLIGKHLWNI